MKFKSALVSLVLAASTLSAETLKEYVEREGSWVPDVSAKDIDSHWMVYMPREDEENYFCEVCEVPIKKCGHRTIPGIVIGMHYEQKQKCSTRIEVYNAKGKSIDRIIIEDLNSNGIYEEGDKVMFDGKSVQRLFHVSETDKDAEKIFNNVYDLARMVCGLVKENKTYASSNKPLNS